MAILGLDNRVTVPEDLLIQRPFSAVVQISVRFPDQAWFTGSGAMIGPDDVLTAGHMIYSEDHGGWAETVIVAPALSPGSAPFGYLTTENMISIEGWTTYQNFNWDYACLDLSDNIGFQTGWFDIESKGGTGSMVESLGYPGDYGSEQMVYTAGTIDHTGANIFKFHDDLDAMPGQSGSPLIYTDAANGDMDVVGIVSHEQYFPSTENGALRLTDAMVTQINGWAENSINDPGSVPPSFSESWYLSRYPDVSAAVDAGYVKSGKAHFDSYGWTEGRDPSENFDTTFYLACNPDVADAGINPLDHYLSWGQHEGRLPNVDAQDYLTRYPDVAEFFTGTAAMHYALWGQYEGRIARKSNAYDDSDFVISNTSGVLSAAGDEIDVVGVQQALSPFSSIFHCYFGSHSV
jgi:V8-like Glu-specific endopeptidase